VRDLIKERGAMLTWFRFSQTVLRLDQVLQQMSPKKMIIATKALPKGLFKYYNYSMTRILNQEHYQREVSLNCLMLISRANQFLEIRQLQDALVFLDGDQEMDEGALIDISIIIANCAGLIAVDTDSGVVRAVYGSILEFLQSYPFPNEQENGFRAILVKFPDLFKPYEHYFHPTNHGMDPSNDDARSIDSWTSVPFSYISSGSTLVNLKPGGLATSPTVPISDLSVVDQFVALFVQDLELATLVGRSLDSEGSSGFERGFSDLIKIYAKELQKIARKDSEKIAAVMAGRRTRALARRLWMTVRAQPGLGIEQKTLAAKIPPATDLLLEEWLSSKDNRNWSSPTGKSKEGTLGGKLEAGRLEGFQETLETGADGPVSEQSSDEELKETYTNLKFVRVFLTRTEPFFDLKQGLEHRLLGCGEEGECTLGDLSKKDAFIGPHAEAAPTEMEPSETTSPVLFMGPFINTSFRQFIGPILASVKDTFEGAICGSPLPPGINRLNWTCVSTSPL
jgi:hypothetical protein